MSHFKKLLASSLSLICALSLAGCNTNSQKPEDGVNAETGCITSFDANKDYFPEKVTFEDATNVSVEYHKSYKVVKVPLPWGGGSPVTYVLVKCGAPEPELTGDLQGATKVTVPVNRITLGSTTQPAVIDALGDVDKIVGIYNAEEILAESVKKAYAAGKIKSIAKDGKAMSVEGIISTTPDVYFSSGDADPSQEQIESAGVPFIGVGQWLEPTPLGRSEWVKYFALFLDKEKEATELYSKIKSDYVAIKEKLATPDHKPTVVDGFMLRGTWYATSPDNYKSRFIDDAGGEMLLKKEAPKPSGNKIGLETVLASASEVDFWVNGSAGAVSRHWTMEEVLAQDPRLGEIKAVREGNVWNPTKLTDADGGNDFWQEGVLRPDLVLADLAAILHPDLYPNHTFTYYEKVE